MAAPPAADQAQPPRTSLPEARVPCIRLTPAVVAVIHSTFGHEAGPPFLTVPFQTNFLRICTDFLDFWQTDPKSTPNQTQIDPELIPNRPPNLPEMYHKSTPNRPQINPRLIPNRPQINPKPTPNSSQIDPCNIDPKSIPNNPKSTQNLPKNVPKSTVVRYVCICVVRYVCIGRFGIGLG